ncbi:MAG: helix-turn-helix transcriptional regulator [Pseudomonadales bacterium]|nr:helix-turn-helix transcriptional regulator [Pseudomonadales bacterium]
MSKKMLNGSTTYPALVGSIIAQCRKDKGIGQAEFATMVGLGQSTWSRIEKGQSALTIEQLAKAAEQLNIEPYELLALVDGARQDLKDQGIETLLNRIGLNNMALLGSIPVVGPTLTAVLSGVSAFDEHSSTNKSHNFLRAKITEQLNNLKEK